ncbi:MAG TPA: RraA family protein [Spirochaetales bacterium]|nr:RraA family protein [Spirochaetales bacterium]HRY55058.1 RraA family protein [Spirochaetia bacterium]HRZ64227.1 RraA family protein [Spirochaetia bacterium]
MEFTKEIAERFMGVDPATFGHYIGGGYMRPEMKPINRRSKMAGPAYTVRLQGRDSFALYDALKRAPKGSVIVIDRCGDATYACVGEMVALCAEHQGFAGIVIDGPATDSLAIEQSGYPVFCTGISVVTTNVLGISGEHGVTISCSGAVVRPGDIVFGDADGVVVIPPDRCLELLAKAEESVAREVGLRAHLKAGGFLKINIDRLREADVLGMINELKKPQ